jgi:tetratricopeptide (TPR) repeat protein
MIVRRLLLGLAMVAAAAAAAWGAWAWLRPRPALDVRRLEILSARNDIDGAEALLRDHLRKAPDDSDAHLRLARLLIERSERLETRTAGRPLAEEAMAHLQRVRPARREEAALAMMSRAKAAFTLSRWDEMEAYSLEALRLDPQVPEAGWGLLGLYYLQGREADASRLALKLYAKEPDPHDRVQLLLELLRQEAKPLAAASRISQLEPAVRGRPDDLQSVSALGAAYLIEGRTEEGLRLLRQAVERHPDDPAAWDGLLTGLDKGGQADAMARALDRLPPALADDPRFAKHRGRVAQDRGDWKAAARAYRRAVAADPHNFDLVYRLARALQNAGEGAEAARWDRLAADYKAAYPEALPLYDEANAIKTLGVEPHPDLYLRIGDLCARLLRPDQARAWYRLALKERPGDPTALAALRRLDAARPPGS